MAFWNYRVMLKDGQLAVHEVFYSDDGSIEGYTADPVFPRADDSEELAAEFERYRGALTEPVLDFAILAAAAEERRARSGQK